MDATLTSKREARLRKRLGKDCVSPSPCGLKAALQGDNGLTKASAVVFGLGNLAYRQIVKGLLFLILETGSFVFLFTNGLGFLTKLPGLGDQKQGKVLADGYWQYTAGGNSVAILLYGVATVLIILTFAGLWNLSVRSAYKAQMLAKTCNRVPSLREDIARMLDGRAHIGSLFLPILGILASSVLPLIFVISMAFTPYDHNNLMLFNWVGLKNLVAIFTNATGIVNLRIFGSILVRTLVWAIFATSLNFFLGIFMMMLINRKTTRFRNFWRACFSMSIAVPQFMPLLVINLMLQPQGAINRLLLDWGWINETLPFFTNAAWAWVTMIIVNLWVGIPFTIMQITGILQNIPADQYKAAKINGANNWVIFRKITTPYIIFVLTPYLITTFIGNVNNFNIIYLLSGRASVPVGDSVGKTDLLITWLYKLTVDKNDYNLGAVVGIMTFIVLAVVSLITYRRSDFFENEEAPR